MLRIHRGLLSLACLTAAVAATAQTPDSTTEITQLKKAAEAKTKQIGELAQKGALPTSDEAIKLLQQMVDELKEIRERLRRLEGQSPTSDSGRLKWQGYAHFQYQDTNRIGADRTTINNDGFRFRRLRIGFTDQISQRMSARVSFDLAGGSDNNTAVSRDAVLAWDASGSSKLGRDLIWGGQFQVPLGYEIERSSADREIPERAQYNQILFPTERSRGLEARRLDGRWSLKAAVMESITIGDPEIGGAVPGGGERLAAFGQAKYSPDKDHTMGVSVMVGRRPEYTAAGKTSPDVPRSFLYFDTRIAGLFGRRLTLMGEAMFGHDRVPSSTANPDAEGNDMAGYHIAGVWDLSGHDRLAVRWEGFDPDLDSGDNNISGLNFAYIRDLNSAMRLTLGYSSFTNESRRVTFNQRTFGQTILRLQFRF